jgi:hypothetical protein
VVTASASSGSLVRLFVANAGASLESGRVQIAICEDHPDCAEGLACGQCLTEKLDTASCR